jgi:hypothetical protein
VLDQEDGDVHLLGEPADDTHQVLAHRRRQPDRRLVEQQERRVGGQRPDDLDHALLAAGQIAHELVLERLDAHQRQKLAGAVHRLRLGAMRLGQAEHQAEEAAADLGMKDDQHVFQHRHLAEQAAVLEGPAHAARRDLVRRHAVDALALEADLAGGRAHVAGDDVEQRRLAGAVRPDQRPDFARVGVEGHAGQRLEPGEMHRQVTDLEQCAHASFPRLLTCNSGTVTFGRVARGREQGTARTGRPARAAGRPV